MAVVELRSDQRKALLMECSATATSSRVSIYQAGATHFGQSRGELELLIRCSIVHLIPRQGPRRSATRTPRKSPKGCVQIPDKILEF